MLGDNGNKCTTWVLGKVMCMWGQGVYGKSLYMPLNFAVNLNCSKNKGLKKKRKRSKEAKLQSVTESSHGVGEHGCLSARLGDTRRD